MLLNSLRHNADECALPVRALCNDMHVPTSTTASFASCRILMFIPGSLQSCQPCHVSLPHTQYTCREFSNISNADMDPTFRIYTPRERGPQCINSLCPYASSHPELCLFSLPPAIYQLTHFLYVFLLPFRFFHMPLPPNYHFSFHSLHNLFAATHERTARTPFRYKGHSRCIPAMCSHNNTIPELSAQAQSFSEACFHKHHHQQMTLAHKLSAPNTAAQSYAPGKYSSSSSASNSVASKTRPATRHSQA